MTQSQPEGFFGIPSTSQGSGHGVLVLHASWGLNDTIKAFCSRLAESGFVAFAPDLYHGKVTDTILDNDEFEPQSNVDELEESLKAVGRPVTFFLYTGSGHWFFEPDVSPAYNPEAANLACDRTLAFLNRSSPL